MSGQVCVSEILSDFKKAMSIAFLAVNSQLFLEELDMSPELGYLV